MHTAATVNKVILAGKIDKEPRWHVKNGQKVLNLSLITTENIRRNGTVELFHEYHHVQVPEYMINAGGLNEGTPVYIQGRLHTIQFTDEQAVKRYKTIIVALSVDLLNF